ALVVVDAVLHVLVVHFCHLTVSDPRRALFPYTTLFRSADGVDLLVHEALAPHLVGILTDAARQAGRQNVAQITEDILDYHASPRSEEHTSELQSRENLVCRLQLEIKKHNKQGLNHTYYS